MSTTPQSAPPEPPHLAHEWSQLTPAERGDVLAWAAAQDPDAVADAPRKRVPDMEFDVLGSSFGGQYWHSQEYRVRFTVEEDRRVLVTAEDTVGAVRTEQALTAAEAMTTYTILSSLSTEESIAGAPHLAQVISWQMPGDGESVDLSNHFDEIQGWLAYATGVDSWDWSENGDTWEY